MTGPERGSDGASAGSRAFAERRRAFDEAKTAVDATLAARDAATPQPPQADGPNYKVLLGGVAVLALLLAGFVFILDRLRDDPWFSDRPASAGDFR